MRTATTIEASAGGVAETVEFVVEAEKLGLDDCWVAEAWGSDAPSALGYLAARTERMLLGSGVIQVGTRTPVAIAQTALTLANMSDGRFLLGLGPSGPQVIEGLHGVPVRASAGPDAGDGRDHPPAFAGGREGLLLRRGVRDPAAGRGRGPMRLSMPRRTRIPIYLATMSPACCELTGEIADGWLGTSFVPEGAADAYFTHLDAGLAGAGRSRADLDVCQGAEVAFAADEDELREMVAGRKKELAFSLGGMGSATTNFYNNAYSRQGWAEVAAEVRERWQAGDRDGAAALVTDEMVLGTTLIGTEPMVRERLRVWRDAGVDTVRLYPAGRHPRRPAHHPRPCDRHRALDDRPRSDNEKTCLPTGTRPPASSATSTAASRCDRGPAITRVRGDKRTRARTATSARRRSGSPGTATTPTG